ncbi:MAG: 16S rRNA (adenine(1518)-N(6)/adenine(1519)-N(6))-dimethyltransferase RsmA [Bdellovibrionales bacterium]
MSLTGDLKARLAEIGIEPKKALGQNFLISRQVIQKIIAAVRSHEGEFKDLIEVGPGVGALTEPLLEAGLDVRLRLIELDRDLIAYWRARGLAVIDADALKLDWETLNLSAPALLVSNLPYQISTHLVVERCLGPERLRWMILMFQKEVAQRLTARPRTKDYGLLSVMAQLHWRMYKIADAAPGDFFPPPKVASRVLAFERISAEGLGTPFLKFLKAAFALRRKFLLKNVKGVVDKAKHDRIPRLLEELGHSDKARAEELSPGDFARLFGQLRDR